jgi:hypothetical protein
MVGRLHSVQDVLGPFRCRVFGVLLAMLGSTCWDYPRRGLIQLILANSVGLLNQVVIVGGIRGSNLMVDILRFYRRKDGVSKFISLVKTDQSRHREAAWGQTRDDLAPL